MFYHGFDNYMEYAFPLDELRPMSCTGEDSLGGYSLTLVSFLAGILNFYLEIICLCITVAREDTDKSFESS